MRNRKKDCPYLDTRNKTRIGARFPDRIVGQCVSPANTYNGIYRVDPHLFNKCCQYEDSVGDCEDTKAHVPCVFFEECKEMEECLGGQTF